MILLQSKIKFTEKKLLDQNSTEHPMATVSTSGLYNLLTSIPYNKHKLMYYN